MGAQALDPAIAAAIGAVAVHDLRNQLAVVESSAHLAATNLDGDAAFARKHLERIQRNTRAAQDLLSRCITVIRGEPLTKNPAKLRVIVAAAIDSVVVPPSITVELDEASLDVEIGCDATLLTRAIANLFQNAISAPRSTGKGCVRLSTDHVAGSGLEPRAESLALLVSDDGAGLPPGFQIGAPSSRAEGLGLGLIAARAIVAAHGGRLEIAAPQPPWTTTFRVELAFPLS